MKFLPVSNLFGKNHLEKKVNFFIKEKTNFVVN